MPDTKNPTSASSDRYLPGRDALPILETGVIQLARGAAQFHVTTLLGKDVVVVRQKIAPKLAGYVVPDPDWLAVFVPLHWSSEFIFNGIEAEVGDTFVSASPNGYSTVSADRDTIAIGVRKRAILDAGAALTGLHLEDLAIRDAVLSDKQVSARNLKGLVLSLLRNPCSPELTPGFFPLSEATELRLIDAIAATLFPDLETKAEGRMWNATALQVVRLAEASVRSNPKRPIALADLCRATGVSNGWLHRCFDEIYGLSPIRCARHWRMTAAREALLDRGADNVLVKQISLRFGFGHSGRFASEYQSIFGELPTETMQRSRRSL